MGLAARDWSGTGSSEGPALEMLTGSWHRAGADKDAGLNQIQGPMVPWGSRVLVGGTPAPETWLHSPEWYSQSLEPRKCARWRQSLNATYSPPQARLCVGCWRIRKRDLTTSSQGGEAQCPNPLLCLVHVRGQGRTEEHPARPRTSAWGYCL